MSEKINKLRVFVFPYIARSHLIPITNLACLLAASHPEVEPTVVVTPENASFIRSTLSRSAASSNPVQFITYTIDTNMDFSQLDQAFHLTRPAQEELLHRYKPDAVIADTNYWWLTATCADLGIPRVVFLPLSTLASLAVPSLCGMRSKIHLYDPVPIPDLPGPQIKIPLSELPDFVLMKDDYLGRQMEAMFKSESESFGFIVNSMYEFEREYCEHYKKTRGMRTYFVGSVSQLHEERELEPVQRGGDGDASCLRWLDTKDTGSVVFICFGSQSCLKTEQLLELAFGLENSKNNFLWVVSADLGEDVIPKGWEERVADRGFLVRGWAPQLMILQHASIGAFLTHCGWNSTVEAVTAGVPVLTWPLQFEQFINERLIVDIKGCGARVWEGGKRSTREEEKELVPQEAIAKAVSQFMDPGGIREKARCNAREAARMAKEAMAEGGSSWRDLNRLITDLFEAKGNIDCK